MRILVVEGEHKTATILQRALESEGYQAVIAPSGEEAFYRLSTELFDLMLLNLMLPKRGGLEVLKLIRSKGHTLPIFILTGYHTAEEQALGLASGADEYLAKPISLQNLSDRIRHRLNQVSHGQITEN